MQALGRHLLLELFDCDAEALNSLDTVKASMVEAAKRASVVELQRGIFVNHGRPLLHKPAGAPVTTTPR